MTTLPETMRVFLSTIYEMSKNSVPKFLLLSRPLSQSAERLRTLDVDSSVSDEKQGLTIIAAKRSKKAFQKARRQHVEGP